MKTITIGLRWADHYDLMTNRDYEAFTKKIETMYALAFPGFDIVIEWLD